MGCRRVSHTPRWVPWTSVKTVGMFGSASNRYGSVAGPRGLSVFAVDPGETTGWAWACVSYKELNRVRDGSLTWQQFWSSVLGVGVASAGPRFDCGQVSLYQGPSSASSVAAALAMSEAQAVLDLAIEIMMRHSASSKCSGGKVTQVTDLVIEDFILRQRTKARNLLAPVRLTAGLVQEVLRSEKLIGITIQSGSDVLGTITDERLKALGLWQVGQQHARDACKHLAFFLRKLVAD